MWLTRRRASWIGLVIALALLAGACSAGEDADTTADGAEDTATDDADADADFGQNEPEPQQVLANELSDVAADLAEGFGRLGAAQQRSITGVVEAGADCADHVGERARPTPSQIEVEIISVVDDCLQFSYDVAGFRSFVPDLQRIRGGADVMAASPLMLDYRINEIDSQWPIEALNADPLLRRPDAPTGAGVVVAVIDSGIDVEDPALTGIDIRRVPDSGSGDYTESGHGTIAASIIVAPIGTAERGLAPGVSLLDVPADLCGPDACGCDPCAAMTPAEAIRWSVDNGADIISMSFGYQPTAKPAWWQLLIDADELAAAVNTMEVSLFYAELRDVAMVGAAGNCATGPSSRCMVEDQFEIPAGHESVVAVGAITLDDDGVATRAQYSTRQPYVELVAPGNLIVTGPDGEQYEKNGTSFATPFVTAALAMMIGADGPLAAQPDMVRVARELLADSAVDLAPEGRDAASGHGQLQLDAALAAAQEFAIENPPPTPAPTAG